ncbi:MAG: alpha/beta hydrolase [Anaerolineales bacterium]|nr:alpha/beta hydrolase [Anaerolineales bacterium]
MTAVFPTLTVQEIEYLDRTFQSLTLSDGRRLGFSQFGAPDGKPIFYFHGGPSSRLEGALLHHIAQQRGYQVICPDRPGHGYSDVKPGYQIVDLADDVRELAQHLNLNSFGVMGTSSGGPPVIACAYSLADQLEFALACGSAAPVYGDPQATKQLSSLDRISARLGLRLPRWMFIAAFGTMTGMIKNIKSQRQYKRVLREMLCEADIKIVDSDPNFVPALMFSIREAFHQGPGGPSDDAIAIYQDWGFSLSEITFPVILAHGTEDKHAPFSFSEYLHTHIPNSLLIPLNNEGHYTHLVNAARSFDLIEGKILPPAAK